VPPPWNKYVEFTGDPVRSSTYTPEPDPSPALRSENLLENQTEPNFGNIIFNNDYLLFL
jgi:hypothetical protein